VRETECHYRPHTDGISLRRWTRIATVCGTCGRCSRYGEPICLCRGSRKWALIDHRWRVGSWMQLGPQQ
jgi:uncharacterized OB-fold protein